MRGGYASGSKYPTENLRKAEIRINIVTKWYEMLGYKVKVYDPSDAENIDMIAENATEVIALEITNWKKECYLSFKKFNGYLRHWKKVENELRAKGDKRTYRKRYIFSYFENIQYFARYLQLEAVELEEIGYQDLPEEQIDEAPIIGWTE